MNKKLYRLFLVFFIVLSLLFLFACKSTGDSNSGKTENTSGKKDPTKYIIDKDNIKEDELRKNMHDLFDLIEKYIAKEDFNGWFDLLSKSYKNYLNDSNELRRLSEISDYLYNRGIVLNNARDYFKHLVVPSRDGKSLEFIDYDYINEKSVNVISLFDKKEKYVYKFIFEDDSWKLSR